MKLNKNVKIAGIIFVGVSVWMLTGVFNDPIKEKNKVVLQTSKVLVKTVNPQKHTPKLEVVGRTKVSDDVDLVAEVSGKVDTINFVQGDFVKEGDLMLVLENGYRKANLESAAQELEAAQLKLDIAENLAKSAYKAKTDLSDRQAEYSRAISNYTNAKRDFDNSFVKAPISGFVEQRNVSLGDYVKNDTVLYKIISQDAMLFEGFLSQNQIQRIKLHQKAYGLFNNDRKANGEVTFIAQKAEEKTKTYKFEITVPKKTEEFRVIEGLTVRIFIPSDEVYVYQVPHSTMVISDDGRVGIRVVNKDNTVEFKEIDIIKDSHDYLLVQTGTNKPLDLIVRGQIDVQSGMVVEVSKSDDKKEKTVKK